MFVRVEYVLMEGIAEERTEAWWNESSAKRALQSKET
jgi:hypothetical protein